MFGSLTIKIVDCDDDCLGIDIRAGNKRFVGTARVYVGLNDLTELADRISGFPQSAADERKCEFGSQKPNSGGFCSMRFSCSDGVGHARLDVVLSDDNGWHEHGAASLGFQVLAADIDRFVLMLRGLEARMLPEAKLETIQ